MSEQNPKTHDLSCSASAILLWWLPVAAIFAGSFWSKHILLFWIPALLVMGAGCLANAARCRRLHCYVTGPLFVLAALYAALWGFHLVPMQPNIFIDSILVITALAYLAEFPLGKYRKKACVDQ